MQTVFASFLRIFSSFTSKFLLASSNVHEHVYSFEHELKPIMAIKLTQERSTFFILKFLKIKYNAIHEKNEKREGRVREVGGGRWAVDSR